MLPLISERSRVGMPRCDVLARSCAGASMFVIRRVIYPARCTAGSRRGWSRSPSSTV